MVLPKTASDARDGARVEGPARVERDRARPGAHLPPGLLGAGRRCYNLEQGAQARCAPGGRRAGATSRCRDEAVSVGFHEAARGVLSHHMVIRDGKIANYQPYPPTPWNASPRDTLRHAGALRGRGAEHADLRGERAGELQGHRHHAGGAQLRPVPAVRRAHVHRQGQGQEGGAHADRARLDGDGWSSPRRSSSGSRALTAQLEAIDDPRRAELAEELVGAMLELYGEGLSGSSRPSTTGRPRPRLAGRRRRREPVLIHGLYPVRSRSGCARRSTSVRPYMESHGGDVELLGRRGRRRPAAAARAAATAARPRRRRSSSRSSRRSRRRRPTCSGSRSRASSAPAGDRDAAAAAPHATGGRRASRLGRARGRRTTSRAGELRAGRWRRRCSSRTSPARCSPTATRCAGCGGVARARELLTRACWPARAAARASTCPRAGRSLDDEGLQLEPVPLLRKTAPGRVALARERTSRGRGAERAPRCGASRRASRRDGAAEPRRGAAATSAAIGDRRGPPAPAAPRGAADRLRLRDAAGRCARATPSSARPAPASCGSTTSTLPDELWARFQIPIGLAFFMRSAAGGVVALYPSPAGATESRARPGGVGRARARRTRCSSELEPDAEALIVNRLSRAAAARDRADRPAATGSSAWSRPAGRGSPAGGRGARRSAGFFDELRAQALR